MLNAALSEGAGNMIGKNDFHISKWHLKEQKSRAVNVATSWDSGNVSWNSFWLTVVRRNQSRADQNTIPWKTTTTTATGLQNGSISGWKTEVFTSIRTILNSIASVKGFLSYNILITISIENVNSVFYCSL